MRNNKRAEKTKNFIVKSIKIHGDNYDYSKCEYRTLKTNVVLICKKHNIEFTQKPITNLKGHIACPLCIEEKYGRHGNGYWTYERCYETAKRYEWLSDFMKNEFQCYSKSLNRNWLEDFTWLKRNYEKYENALTAKKHCIYKYDFPEYNTVYTGLTIDIDRRHSNGHFREGPVYNFCKENNLEIPNPQIVEGNLTIEESQIREAFWIEHYKEQGYNLLNKAKAGSVGTLYILSTEKKTEQFISKAKKVHGDKYNYSKVVYKKAKTIVLLSCPIHGDFSQTPSNHLKGKGCPKCKNKKIGDKLRFTKGQFISRTKEVHGNKYDYTNVVYKNNITKVVITCPLHGKFEQSPSNHLQGQGCPICGSAIKLTTEDFITRARKVHGDKYGYEKVVYEHSETKVIITCPVHGDFEQTPHGHLKGYGCQKCGGSIRLTTEEFISKARIVHGTKYEYSKVQYINGQTKVVITCPIHGEFLQIPNNHLRGQNCPKCAIRKKK